MRFYLGKASAFKTCVSFSSFFFLFLFFWWDISLKFFQLIWNIWAKGPLPLALEGTAFILLWSGPCPWGQLILCLWVHTSACLWRSCFKYLGTQYSVSRWPWTSFYSLHGPLDLSFWGPSQPLVCAPEGWLRDSYVCVGAMGVMALSFWLTEELKEPPRFWWLPRLNRFLIF